jgi:hypothetical protein
MSALDKLKDILAKVADANSSPVSEKEEAQTQALFSRAHKEDILWWQNFFRKKDDPNGRIKILGGIIIGIASTATGVALTFAPPDFLPEHIKAAGCRDSGPTFIYAGLGLLAGFAVQRL